MICRFVRTVTLITVFNLFLSPALAGTTDTDKEKEENVQLDTVIVTSGKTVQKVEDVPAGMDVFSGAGLDDAGIETTHDLTRYCPNVTMKQNYTEHVNVIRGIPSFRASIHSPAGLYIDDVSYPLHYTQNTALFDVEQVEILKSPQGHL